MRLGITGYPLLTLELKVTNTRLRSGYLPALISKKNGLTKLPKVTLSYTCRKKEGIPLKQLNWKLLPAVHRMACIKSLMKLTDKIASNHPVLTCFN